MKVIAKKQHTDIAKKLNALVSIKDNKSKGWINWGKKNNFPVIAYEMISQSATATSCYNVKSQFLQADGFVDRNVAEMMANEDQTFDQLLAEVCQDFAWMDAFAMIHQKSDINGFGFLRHIPVAWCRLSISGEYVYVNEHFGTSDYKESETKKYPLFGSGYDQLQQIEEHGEHLGEIIFAFRNNMLYKSMPVPSWFSGERDVLTEAELSYYDYETITNGMQVNGFFVLVGSKNQTIEDDGVQSELDETIETINNFSFRGERNKTMVLTVDTPEEMPKWIGQDSKGVFDAASGMRDRIARAICRAWEVPPVLVGLETPGRLGSSQQLEMELNVFNMKLNPYQRFITSVFTLVAKEYGMNLNFTISTLNIAKVDEVA